MDHKRYVVRCTNVGYVLKTFKFEQNVFGERLSKGSKEQSLPGDQVRAGLAPHSHIPAQRIEQASEATQLRRERERVR